MSVSIPEVLGKDQCCIIGKKEWRVSALIKRAEELEVFELPIKYIDLTISYNFDSMRELCGHVKLIQEADLESPIILNEDGALMDGHHRVMKAILEGKDTVKAVKFEVDPPCEWRRD